jgi:hypothetical protein
MRHLISDLRYTIDRGLSTRKQRTLTNNQASLMRELFYSIHIDWPKLFTRKNVSDFRHSFFPSRKQPFTCYVLSQQQSTFLTRAACWSQYRLCCSRYSAIHRRNSWDRVRSCSAQNISTLRSNAVGNRNTANWSDRSSLIDFNSNPPPASLPANQKYFPNHGTVVPAHIFPRAAR